MSSTTANPNLKNRCFRILRKVSSAHGILPKSYFLPEVTLNDNIPFASGGPADVWKGQQYGKQLCVKVFRTQPVANLDKVKRVCSGSLFQCGGELNLVPNRWSTVKSWGGSAFRIRTSYHSSEFRRRCSHFASSALGCRMETSPSTSGNVRKSIDHSW